MTGKVRWKPGNAVFPAPAALVSCRSADGRANLITIGWCGNINTNPSMLSISVRPERHSHGIISETREFALNIPSAAQARAVDYCGVVSGRDVDKFAATGLTPVAVDGLSCPAVAECPITISCRVTERISLGSHDMFLARVEGIDVDPDLMDKTGRFRIERADLLCYAHGFYFALGRRMGHFGWSVRKKPVAAGKGGVKNAQGGKKKPRPGGGRARREK